MVSLSRARSWRLEKTGSSQGEAVAELVVANWWRTGFLEMNKFADPEDARRRFKWNPPLRLGPILNNKTANVTVASVTICTFDNVAGGRANLND